MLLAGFVANAVEATSVPVSGGRPLPNKGINMAAPPAGSFSDGGAL